MSMNKYDDVITLVQKVIPVGGTIQPVYFDDFKKALKKKPRDVNKIKSTSTALLIKLKKLRALDPDVKKAINAVTELTKITDSDDQKGSPRTTSGANGDSRKSSLKAKLPPASSHRGVEKHTVSNESLGTHGQTVGSKRTTKESKGKEGTLEGKHSLTNGSDDGGRFFSQFLDELKSILSGRLERFSDTTLTSCNTVYKTHIHDVQQHVIKHNERHANVMRSASNSFTKRLEEIRDSFKNETYSTSAEIKDGITSNDPDQRILAVIQTDLCARHKQIMDVEQRIKALEVQISFDEKKTENSTKQQQKLSLARIEDSLLRLETHVMDRLGDAENAKRHILEVDRKLTGLLNMMSGNRFNSAKDDTPNQTMERIQNSIAILEKHLSEKGQAVDEDLGTTPKQFKSYVTVMRELEKEIEKGEIVETDNKTKLFPKEVVNALQSLRKRCKERQRYMNSMQQEIKQLTKDMNDKVYDNTDFKTRTHDMKPTEPFKNIEMIRTGLKQKTIELDKMKAAIVNLKKQVEDMTFVTEKKPGDSEWEKHIFDILKKCKSVLQPEKGLSLEHEIKQLSVELETGHIQAHKPKENKKRGSDESVVNNIRMHIARVHQELQSIKSKVCATRNTLIDGVANERQADNAEMNCESCLGEIRQITISYKEDLHTMKSTHVEIAEVSDELDIMEHRLIATYQQRETKGAQRTNRNPTTTRGGVTQSIKAMVDRIDEIMNSQQSEIKRCANENVDLKRELDSIRSDIAGLQNEAKKLGKEKNDLVLRLSSIAGAKLTENNPNIADLSDPNRPTKLAEKYREIYDTEWTDAYETFEKDTGLTEREICIKLVDVLMNAYERCTELSQMQKVGLCKCLLNPTMDTTVTPSVPSAQTDEDTHLNSIQLKMISDLRKQTADKSASNVIKSFEQSDNLPSDTKILTYRDKCVEICWYMSLQTPPVVLEILRKDQKKFNRDKYSEYTKKGTTVDFVTWPPLLLNEGGPLLCKGIAQGK